MSLDNFIEAIRTGNVAFLEEFLNQHPEQLRKVIGTWKSNSGDASYGSGAALHCAATCDQLDVIEFLVNEKRADVNQRCESSALWTPLHYAEDAKAYRAAARLLQLGAHPALENNSGKNTQEFCQSEQVQQLLDPDYQRKQEERKEQARQKKIAGTWTRNTSHEVVHNHELPGQYHLTDIFNFKTRSWRTIVKDLSSNIATHSVVFFDDVPDTEILHQALQKLKAAGGDAPESSIDARLLRGKSALSSPSL